MFTKIHIFRLKPDQKLFEGILDFCQKQRITSGVIISLLGSLNKVELGFLKKLPGKYITQKINGPLEIVSGNGTVAKMAGKTVLHVHLEVSNDKYAIGGHLVEGTIFSTAEVIIGQLKEQINREKDNFTGLNELK
ncbi:MAG: PPC domain-containing DNA-binding protein [Patescibacteria group bacterium]